MADRTYTATVDGTGNATVTIKPDGVQTWVVSQVSVEMPTAPGGATCVVRKNGYSVTPLVAQNDTAGGDPYVTVLPSDRLTVEWALCTTGDTGRVLAFYEEST